MPFFDLGERGRIRTCDPRLKRALLYHLSYAPSPISNLTHFPHESRSWNAGPSLQRSWRDDGIRHECCGADDLLPPNAVHSARMRSSRLVLATLMLALGAIFLPAFVQAKKKPELPTVRWTAGTPGCTFERGQDGMLRWTMSDKDVDMTLLVNSQELSKSKYRLAYRFLAVDLAVKYKGPGKLDFPADLRMDFIRHHEVVEGFEDPLELQNRLQNDVDTQVFEAERQIKKHPELKEQKTAVLREYEKESAELIEFLTTKYLEPATLNPGNPEVHGWVFFATKNKWIGPWKEHEDFLLGVYMKDKVWQFPFSLPPAPEELILRKPPE